MLPADRKTQKLEDRYFAELPASPQPGDVLVLNKVLPARLPGSKRG